MSRTGRTSRLPFLAVLAALAALAALAGAARANDGLLFDPMFREGAPSDRLIDGDPPLSRGHLNAFVDLFEASFDLALPADAEQDLRDALETGFEAASSEQRSAFLVLVAPMPLLREHARRKEDSVVRSGLRTFRTALDERLRSRPRDTAHKLLTQALERRHEIVWPGAPPIKGGSVDAYFELISFVVGLGRNQRFEPSEGQSAALIAELRRELHAQPKPVREALAEVHRTWLQAKAAWDDANPAERFRMRWQAVRVAARLLPEDKRFAIVPGPDLPSYAREAARVRAAEDSFTAFSNAARHPKAVLEAVESGLQLEASEPQFTFMYR